MGARRYNGRGCKGGSPEVYDEHEKNDREFPHEEVRLLEGAVSCAVYDDVERGERKRHAASGERQF